MFNIIPYLGNDVSGVVHQFLYEAPELHSFDAICSGAGKIEGLEYLHITGQLQRIEPFKKAIIAAAPDEVLLWLQKNGYPVPKDAVDIAAGAGQAPALSWLFSRGYRGRIESMNSIIKTRGYMAAATVVYREAGYPFPGPIQPEVNVSDLRRKVLEVLIEAGVERADEWLDSYLVNPPVKFQRAPTDRCTAFSAIWKLDYRCPNEISIYDITRTLCDRHVDILREKGMRVRFSRAHCLN